MRTMEGRQVKEHEDLIIRIYGHGWEEYIDKHSCIDTWLRNMRPKISEFLKENDLPQDPK